MAVVGGAVLTYPPPQIPALFSIAGGLLVLGLGVLALVQQVLERRWDRSRPGPALATDPRTGAPSTLLARAAWTVSMQWCVSAVLCLPLLVAAAGAALQQHWVAGVVLAGTGAGLAAVGAPRGQQPGGVHLTAEGLTVVHGGRVRWTRWDQVDDFDATGSFWTLELHPRGRVHVQLHHLAVHPDDLVHAMVTCRIDTDVRSQAGTRASLDWAAWHPR